MDTWSLRQVTNTQRTYLHSRPVVFSPSCERLIAKCKIISSSNCAPWSPPALGFSCESDHRCPLGVVRTVWVSKRLVSSTMIAFPWLAAVVVWEVFTGSLAGFLWSVSSGSYMLSLWLFLRMYKWRRVEIVLRVQTPLQVGVKVWATGTHSRNFPYYKIK